MSTIHEGVRCDACGKQDFQGTRYACLLCQDYDLCDDCHRRGQGIRRAFKSTHTCFHPVQPVATPYDFVQRFASSSTRDGAGFTIFLCPYCRHDGFSLTTLWKHLDSMHQHQQGLPNVRCPVCVTFRIGLCGSDLLDCSLAAHIQSGHAGFGSDLEWKYKLLQYTATSYSRGEGSTWLTGCDGAVCSICSSKLGQDANLYLFLNCGHGYHGDCINGWMNDHEDGGVGCPRCRESFEEQQ